MEELLRSKEMDQIEEIFEKAFDFSSKVVYFPVRHHSPACSFHLKKTIEDYQPEIILIEGPEDANEIKGYLCEEGSIAPFCIYYSYSDSKHYLDENKGKYRCYYPFLDYSPELVALREGKQRNIETLFIDLPFAEILINSEEGKGLRNKQDKNSYNDDYFLERSKFTKLLCEKQGCRNFHELWEKLFEIDGLKQDSATFVKNMMAHCFFSRFYSSAEEMKNDGCTARESYMSLKILEASKKYNKILVVTGGFHTSGLIELMEKKETLKLHTFGQEDIGVYAMAYSFEAADQLNGYASGMPHPAFYQNVWENLKTYGEKSYENSVLSFIVKCGSILRKKEGGISTAEEIEAFSMAKGLAAFRDKDQCGVYELMDGIRTSFVKGELNMVSDAPFKILSKLLRGKNRGKLCDSAKVPPIVVDFRDSARYFRFKINTSVEQEITLEIYKTPRHREESYFFHRLVFLNTSFCKLLKGPDFVNKKNTNLVREIWKYKWSINVESTLIENSVYGGTLKEACTFISVKKLEENSEHAGEVAILLSSCFIMGLEEIFVETLPSLSNIISKDGNFFSLVECIYQMKLLYHMRLLCNMDANGEIKKVICFCYNKLALLIPETYKVPFEEEDKIIAAFKNIYQVVIDRDMELDGDIIKEAFLRLVDKKDGNSAIEGAALGLLVGMNAISADYVVESAQGYLFGTGEKFLKSAAFLKGLFSTARDVVFNSDNLINGINNVMKNIDEEDFLRILPELRLAFSFFNPGEIDEISKQVADLYGIEKKKITSLKGVNPDQVKMANELDLFGINTLREWGMLDGK